MACDLVTLLVDDGVSIGVGRTEKMAGKFIFCLPVILEEKERQNLKWKGIIERQQQKEIVLRA